MGVIKKILLGLMLITLTTACSKSEDDDDSGGGNNITIAGSFSNVGSYKVSAKANDISPLAITDYTFYCVTFSVPVSAASSAISSSGSFSLQIPANTPFGCFVIHEPTSKQVATVVVDNTSSGSGGYGDADESMLSLGQSVNLSGLELDLTNGKVAVPAAQIAAAESAVSPSFSPADLHNHGFTMSCVNTGDTEIDTACANFVNQGNTVFFRTLVAMSGSETIYGLGVWESQTKFNDCGAIDMLNSQKTSIETDDSITFTQIATSSAFTSGGNCVVRSNSDGTIDGPEDLESYFALAPLEVSANGYSLHVEDDNTFNSGNCTEHHYTNVTFTAGSSSTEYIGSFATGSKYTGSNCGSNTDSAATFVIKFTQAY